MRSIAKRLVEWLILPVLLPALLLYCLQRLTLGRVRACQYISQRASRWPGLGGEYLRRVLHRLILARVGRDVVISFGSILTKPTAELDEGVYIGSYCLLGDVRIGRDTLIADQVLIPSGSHQHGLARLDVAVRQQEGTFDAIRIGRDCWIGSGSIILADVGDHCVVAAGSVVTRAVADYQIVAGVPSKVIGDRRQAAGQAAEAAQGTAAP